MRPFFRTSGSVSEKNNSSSLHILALRERDHALTRIFTFFFYCNNILCQMQRFTQQQIKSFSFEYQYFTFLVYSSLICLIFQVNQILNGDWRCWCNFAQKNNSEMANLRLFSLNYYLTKRLTCWIWATLLIK